MKPVRVALLGCGTVGSEVVRLLHEQAADLTARIGAPVEIAVSTEGDFQAPDRHA